MEKTLFVFYVEQISADVEKALTSEPGFSYNTEHVSEKNVSPILGEVLHKLRKEGHKIVLISKKPFSEFSNKEIAFISLNFDQTLVGGKDFDKITFKVDNFKENNTVFISDEPEFLGRVSRLSRVVGITSQDAGYSDFSKEGVRELINGFAHLPSYLLQKIA